MAIMLALHASYSGSTPDRSTLMGFVDIPLIA